MEGEREKQKREIEGKNRDYMGIKYFTTSVLLSREPEMIY